MKKEKFYITTPIYYANGDPHIGHAYTMICSDILARFNRMRGFETYFLCGSDEHGEKIQEAADKNNMEVQAFVDKHTAKFEMTWDSLNISNDSFIRTTNSDHKKAVERVLQRLYDNGFIYKGVHKGLYCVGCEQYKTERDLISGKCPDHQKKPIEMKEECYMFKLREFESTLKKKINSNDLQILPTERKNEVLSFINNGFKDISFSRKIKWGVELPWDRSQTAYVWPDAFLNYITGLNWDGGEQIPHMWPAHVHIMGKDIVRVHATIWPAMLLGLGLPLPKKLFVHGFFLVDGQKMSKSIGNVITPDDMIDKFGVDATRYLLASATPFGHDADIGYSKFNEKYNGDLANGLGNLLSRSITLAEKMGESGIRLTQPDNTIDNWNGEEFQHEILSTWEYYVKSLHYLRIELGIKIIQSQIKFLDNYITVIKPWELIKSRDERVGEVMYNILERIRHIAMMTLPYMPEIAESIIASLGLNMNNEKKRSIEEFSNWGELDVNTKLFKGDVLFPRK